MGSLDELADRVRTRDDFVAFLGALRADLVAELSRPEEELAYGGGRWSHADLDGFLEALAAWLADARAFEGLGADAWAAFAEMLLAARAYE